MQHKFPDILQIHHGQELFSLKLYIHDHFQTHFIRHEHESCGATLGKNLNRPSRKEWGGANMLRGSMWVENLGNKEQGEWWQDDHRERAEDSSGRWRSMERGERGLIDNLHPLQRESGDMIESSQAEPIRESAAVRGRAESHALVLGPCSSPASIYIHARSDLLN